MRNNDEKIIDFGRAREMKLIEKASHSHKRGLTLLSFTELNQEINHLIDDINTTPITRDLISKSSAIFKELYSRIEDESHELADAIREMKKDIESKISQLF